MEKKIARELVRMAKSLVALSEKAVAKELAKVLDGKVYGPNKTDWVWYEVYFEGAYGEVWLDVSKHDISIQDGDLTGQEKMLVKGIGRRGGIREFNL